MNWSDIPRRPPRSTLRSFAGIWLVWFAGLAGWQAASGNAAAASVLAAAAAAVGLSGVVRPAAVRPVFVGSLVLTFPVGWAVWRLLLAALFFGAFTPLAVYFRLIRRDPLGLRPAPNAATYWSPKPLRADLRSYFHLS